jgi:hypothetical protein
VQKKTSSSQYKKLRAPLSHEKIDAELEASMRVDVEKWMASLKKAPPPKKSAKELEVERMMLRCLVEPKSQCRQTINAPCRIHIVQRGQMRF